MDASSRAELENLRRRAYGPDADIDDDPAALARLEELEDRVRAEHLVLAGAVGGDAGPGGDGPGSPGHGGSRGTRHPPPDDTAAAHDRERSRDEIPDAAAPADPSTTAAGSRRRVGVIALVAAVVVALGAVVVPRLVAPFGDPRAAEDPMRSGEAYSLARDDEAFVLLRIPIRASFDDGVDLPAGSVPDFPSSGAIEWAEPLGEYYGWNVWIAGAAGTVQREHCLLAERDGTIRGRCVPAVLRSQSALAVSLPYRLVPRDERPDSLDRDERIGFWWNVDGEVTVLLAADQGASSTEWPADELASLAPAAASARRFTDSPTTETLLFVPFDAAFDGTRDGPEEQPVPGFPVAEPLSWSDGLGSYFGADVWRGYADSGRRCLLVELPTTTRSGCVDAGAFDQDAMLVLVPFGDLPDDKRPPGMTADQSVGFHWRGDARLDVLLGPSPDAAPAD